MSEIDLWWEARQTTAAMRPPFKDQVTTLVRSLPGRPAQVTMGALAIGREDNAIVADLNLYRPNYNLQALIDRGVNRFILRMGGPRAWIEGDWRYQEDSTWRPYMTELDRLGVDVGRQVLGYYIHNAAEDWRLAGDLDTHVQLINTWTSGGFMPAGFICDHEVAEFWRGGTKITITNFNLVESLKAVTAKVYAKWRKCSAIYSARWFMDRFGPNEHTTYLNNVNRPPSAGGEGMQRPMWYAWVPQPALGNTVWSSAKDCVDQLLVPTGDQVGRFLNMGDWSLYGLWQYLFSFRTPEMVAANQPGIDLSISRGTLAEFDALFGLTSVEPEPDPEDPPVVDAELAARVAELETDVAELKLFREHVKAA